MVILPGQMSEIVILIDISSFGDQVVTYDVIEHIREAVSFQISREAIPISNRKLIKLGFGPNLARVKWAYSFVDTTSNASQQPSVIGRPLEPLTYERWDLFEKDMNEAVKEFQSKMRQFPPSATAKPPTMNTRIANLMQILELVQFPIIPVDDIKRHNHHLRRLSGDVVHPDLDCTCKLVNSERFVFIFTSVPKTFSTLIHLARGLTQCRDSLSNKIKCSPKDLQICLVDLQFDPTTGQINSDNNYSFWDELHEDTQTTSNSCSSGGGDGKCNSTNTNFNLKISCLKKILIIHKLEELRHPWKYDDSARLPFGFGMGMKRLRQLEWRIPEDFHFRRESNVHCLPLRLRRCWSDEQ